MKYLFVLALLFSFSVQAAAPIARPLPLEQCQVQVPYGQPIDHKTDTTLVCRMGYFLEHDDYAHVPVWVSYVLTPGHVLGCYSRSNAFSADPSVASSIPNDYYHAGYDKGHQANDDDMRWNKQAERESFLMSNMAPQLPGFNRGIWKKLEDQTRIWGLTRNHPLLIYVGPVYNRKEDPKIGQDSVVVPHAFYKIIVDTVTNEAIVFFFQHAPSTADLSTFLTTVNAVQEQTGVTFPLPPNATIAKQLWPSTIKSITKAKKKSCALS